MNTSDGINIRTLTLYLRFHELLKKFVDKFDYDRSIRMIPAKHFKIKLDVISNKYVNICFFKCTIKYTDYNYTRICFTAHVSCVGFFFFTFCTYSSILRKFTVKLHKNARYFIWFLKNLWQSFCKSFNIIEFLTVLLPNILTPNALKLRHKR